MQSFITDGTMVVYIWFSYFEAESFSAMLQIIKRFPSLAYSFDPRSTPQILNEIKPIRFLFRTRDWKKHYITTAATQYMQRRAAKVAFILQVQRNL
jgi:hypothetical protein